MANDGNKENPQNIDDAQSEKQRNDENNAKNIQNAAEVAIASKNPYAAAAGAVVKYGDKLTGGKVSQAAGKVITQANKHSPMGKKVQKASNKLAESGASDAIGTAASMKSGGKGGSNFGDKASKMGSAAKAAEARNKGNQQAPPPKEEPQEDEEPRVEYQNNSNKKEKDKKKKSPILLILLLISPLFMFLIPFALLILLIAIVGGNGGGSAATDNYYSIECEDATVILVNDDYEAIGNETYPLDEYIAGVINNEVGMFGNIEVYKQFAIAARTFFLRNQDNCTLEASDRRQTFSEVTESTPNGELMMQAAQETSGIVLLDTDGNLINSEYDAFCSIAVDENYYTIKQQNQKIPRTWVDSQSGIAAEWKQGDCTGNHGRGMSQWGSYYLATEEDYTYEELIQYYLGSENVSISGRGFMSSVANLDIKNTGNATNIHEPISSFLASHNSSLEQYNEYIKNSVESVGVGTRAGVVAAAVSAINFLYDNYNHMIPYYWGGSYMGVGAPSFIGESAYAVSSSGTPYYYNGFDCSGFVSWAVRNGGYKLRRTLAGDFHTYVPSSSVCNGTSQSCIGQPGDIIEDDTHVVLIVAVDEANNKYFIAESQGGNTGVIIREYNLHPDMNIVKMDSFYNNSENVEAIY